MLPAGWFLFPLPPPAPRPLPPEAAAPDAALPLALVLRPLREDRPDPLHHRLDRARRVATSLRVSGRTDLLARALADHLAAVAASDGPRSLRYRVLGRQALAWLDDPARLGGVRLRVAAAAPATAGRLAPEVAAALELLDDTEAPPEPDVARALARLRAQPAGPPVGLALQDLERVEGELAWRGHGAAAARLCRARLALLELDRVERGVDPAEPDPELEAARLHLQARRTRTAWVWPENPRP